MEVALFMAKVHKKNQELQGLVQREGGSTPRPLSAAYVSRTLSVCIHSS